MARRGRPPHPDVLTPREWEALALLRDGLSNEEIAERLGISMGGAKYHVSEILSKLGVKSREEAARWQPRARPWWAAVVAPVAWPWRKAGSGPLAAAAAATAGLLIAAGVGLLVWGLARTSGGSTQSEPPGTAFVYIGGTIESISGQQLVVRDLEGHLVTIRVEHADGPEAQFCDHRTPIPMCMVLSEAAPSRGEGVCVMAHLMPAGELIAWLVHLDSQCRQVPAPTTALTP